MRPQKESYWKQVRASTCHSNAASGSREWGECVVGSYNCLVVVEVIPVAVNDGRLCSGLCCMT